MHWMELFLTPKHSWPFSETTPNIRLKSLPNMAYASSPSRSAHSRISRQPVIVVYSQLPNRFRMCFLRCPSHNCA